MMMLSNCKIVSNQDGYKLGSLKTTGYYRILGIVDELRLELQADLFDSRNVSTESFNPVDEVGHVFIASYRCFMANHKYILLDLSSCTKNAVRNVLKVRNN